MKRKTLERFVNGAYGDEQRQLLEAPKGWEEQWVGLPEFAQPRREPYALIHVRFATAEDLAEFSRLVGQRCLRTTKAIWYPEIVKGIHSKYEYVDSDRNSTHTDDASGSELGSVAAGNDPQGTEERRVIKRPKKLIGQQSLFKGENE